MTTRLPVPEVVRTQENALGGVLVVTQPGYGPEEYSSARRAFLFDKSVDRGPVLNRFGDWFELWGIDVKRVRGTEGAFERSFFTLEWPEVPVSGHGPQTVPRIAEHILALRDCILERRPRLVIFLSCYLWQAVNLPSSLEVLSDACGSPLDHGRRITTERLAAYVQKWSKLQMLALPQPSKNTTEKCVLAMAQGVRQTLEECAPAPENVQDPLTESALDFLYQAGGEDLVLTAAKYLTETSDPFDAVEALVTSECFKDVHKKKSDVFLVSVLLSSGNFDFALQSLEKKFGGIFGKKDVLAAYVSALLHCAMADPVKFGRSSVFEFFVGGEKLIDKKQPEYVWLQLLNALMSEDPGKELKKLLGDKKLGYVRDAAFRNLFFGRFEFVRNKVPEEIAQELNRVL